MSYYGHVFWYSLIIANIHIANDSNFWFTLGFVLMSVICFIRFLFDK